MPHIHIHRPHQLGLPAARKIAFAWAEKVEKKFDMDCTYAEGTEQDTLHFSRLGVTGTLQVHPDQFALAAELGFLLSAFKDSIEAELNKQFDSLLLPKKPAAKKAAQKKKPAAPSA
ncbi:polyhydroxyalkanoic acid system family protein [Simplicispira psychrophila]|uniref:polyhydroxyalkanoic acid system family protein n=1 Tax=Simplicispira psychrophila TaxID=80882 RepID=UPI00048A2B1C|nr:polyhydroxyalkanoic acid system family protein [Simplicispira psychrophila]